jgi:hypothetical protein
MNFVVKKFRLAEDDALETGTSNDSLLLRPIGWPRQHSLTPVAAQKQFGGNSVQTDDLAHRLKTGSRIACLVGAGISIPAGIPGAREIVRLLRQRTGRPLPDNYADAMAAAFPGDDGPHERRRLIEELCAGVPPAHEHYLLAHLIEKRVLDVLLTTNFDHLAESAAATYSSLMIRVFLNDADYDPQPIDNPTPALLKLHGDFLFDDLANLETEMRNRVNANMRTKLRIGLQRRGLVVLGYGGGDHSVMSMLAECLRSPDCLEEGIWWVLKDPASVQHNEMFDALRLTAEAAKKSFVVMTEPEGAATFLRSLCHACDAGLPESVRFGIRSGAPLPGFAYVARFSIGAPPAPGDYDPKIRDLTAGLTALEQAREQHPCVWIEGAPEGGKSVAVGEFLKRQDRRPVFYQSARFARNTPLTGYVTDRLERFANSLAIRSSARPHLGVARDIFRAGALVVFDDLPGTGLGPTDNLCRLLSLLIVAHADAGAGQLLFVSSYAPPLDLLTQFWREWKALGIVRRPLTIGHFRTEAFGEWPAENARSRFAAFVDGDKDRLQTLQIMSCIRFAESRADLCRAIHLETANAILDRGVEQGLFEERQQHVALRQHLRPQVWEVYPIAPSVIATVAAAFHGFAADDSPARFMTSVHHEFEAVNLFFQADDYIAAARIDAALQPRVLEVGLGEQLGFEASAYADLRDYFVRWPAIRTDLLERLERESLIDLVVAFLRALHRTGFRDPVGVSAFGHVKEDLDATLERGWVARLNVRVAAVEGNAEAALAWAREGIAEFDDDKESSRFAEALLDLALATAELSERRLDVAGFEEALRVTEQAEVIFARLGLRDRIQSCRENRSGYLLRLDRIEAALAVITASFGDEPGLSYRKGFLYGNLFVCHLRQKDAIRAEACFLESNLNFSASNHWEGIVRNLMTLFIDTSSENPCLPEAALSPVHVLKAMCAAAAFRQIDNPSRLPRAALAIGIGDSFRQRAFVRLVRLVVVFLMDRLRWHTKRSPRLRRFVAASQ